MINDVNDIKVGDKVIEDGFHEEMEIISIRPLTNDSRYYIAECKQIGKDNKDFLLQQLSILKILDTNKYPHLILLRNMLEEVFTKGTDVVSIHYFPQENPYASYCFESVTLPEKLPSGETIPMGQGFKGLGMHIHWLWMHYREEIISFLGEKFFAGERVRLARLVPNAYSMEYWG